MKRILFVDDQPETMHDLRQALAELHPEWEMDISTCGDEALKRMFRSPYDVVVADMVMPGMDGVEMLTKVMHRHPTTVRIIISGHLDWNASLRLMGTAHQYLTKPFSAQELAETIARALALRELLANEQLKRLVSQVQSLPSIPGLYLELLEELRKAEPSPEKVGDIIARDLGMCTKLLHLVNSAFFALPRNISNPQEAVIYLGLETVKALVLSLQIFSLFERIKVTDFSYDKLWSHSWMTGVLARRIAEAENFDARTTDEAFIGGLLHDVGKLVLVTGVPSQFQKALTLAHEKRLPLWQAEQELLKATHAEVGAYLLGLWGLPDAVVEAVALHHVPARNCYRSFSPLTVVHVANALAYEFATGPTATPPTLVDRHYLIELGMDDRLPAWRELARTLAAREGAA